MRNQRKPESPTPFAPARTGIGTAAGSVAFVMAILLVAPGTIRAQTGPPVDVLRAAHGAVTELDALATPLVLFTYGERPAPMVRSAERADELNQALASRLGVEIVDVTGLFRCPDFRDPDCRRVRDEIGSAVTYFRPFVEGNRATVKAAGYRSSQAERMSFRYYLYEIRLTRENDAWLVEDIDLLAES